MHKDTAYSYWLCYCPKVYSFYWRIRITFTKIDKRIVFRHGKASFCVELILNSRVYLNMECLSKRKKQLNRMIDKGLPSSRISVLTGFSPKVIVKYRKLRAGRKFLQLKREETERKIMLKLRFRELKNAAKNNKRLRKNRRTSAISKQELVALFGGKCFFCGYSNCLNALEFHHVSQEHKQVSISIALARLDKELVIKEASKCLLLCSNCHRELHYGQTRKTP